MCNTIGSRSKGPPSSSSFSGPGGWGGAGGPGIARAHGGRRMRRRRRRRRRRGGRREEEEEGIIYPCVLVGGGPRPSAPSVNSVLYQMNLGMAGGRANILLFFLRLQQTTKCSSARAGTRPAALPIPATPRTGPRCPLPVGSPTLASASTPARRRQGPEATPPSATPAAAFAGAWAAPTNVAPMAAGCRAFGNARPGSAAAGEFPGRPRTNPRDPASPGSQALGAPHEVECTRRRRGRNRGKTSLEPIRRVEGGGGGGGPKKRWCFMRQIEMQIDMQIDRQIDRHRHHHDNDVDDGGKNAQALVVFSPPPVLQERAVEGRRRRSSSSYFQARDPFFWGNPNET